MNILVCLPRNIGHYIYLAWIKGGIWGVILVLAVGLIVGYLSSRDK